MNENENESSEVQERNLIKHLTILTLSECFAKTVKGVHERNLIIDLRKSFHTVDHRCFRDMFALHRFPQRIRATIVKWCVEL